LNINRIIPICTLFLERPSYDVIVYSNAYSISTSCLNRETDQSVYPALYQAMTLAV